MELRRLTPNDAVQYVPLRLRALKEQPTLFGSSYEEESVLPPDEWVARLAERVIFGAFDGGILLGTAGIYRHARPKTRHRAELVGMHVVPEARGRGIGRQLVNVVLDYARQQAGLTIIELSVTTGNDDARRLYRRAGFRTWGVEPHALMIDGRTYDLEWMALEL